MHKFLRLTASRWRQFSLHFRLRLRLAVKRIMLDNLCMGAVQPNQTKRADRGGNRIQNRQRGERNVHVE